LYKARDGGRAVVWSSEDPVVPGVRSDVGQRDHVGKQQQQSDAKFAHGSRSHVTSTDPLVQYLVRWRLTEAFRRLRGRVGAQVTTDVPILVMCSGEGFDGTILCDIGFTNVTVSDVSQVGVDEATGRDSRLKGMRLDALQAGIDDDSFPIVVVQDGLHHLPNPVAGFTEMLRIASIAAIFLEPHRSLVGRVLGQTWERNGEAVNYVFRWDRALVEDVASSYLGPDAFDNLSFSFWHHNLHLERLGRRMGGGERGRDRIRLLKRAIDLPFARVGNQFCGLIVMRT
jgi:SAM-dependent methyltransferase